MEAFYHVEIESTITTARFLVRPNLTKDQVEGRILWNYNYGRAITLRGVALQPTQIVRMTIAYTHDKVDHSYTFERLTDYMSGQEWWDATDSFVVGPPGWKASLENKNELERLALSQVYDRMVTNEQLREVTRKRFLDGHYSDSVEAALKCVDNSVRDRSGLVDASGAHLMWTAFSEKAPVLSLNALISESDKNAQRGYMHIFAGTMMGIRNPRAHEHDLVDNAEAALESLILANHLMRMLDGAIKNEPETA